ncbi:MAG: hypothetical protein ISS93_00185 [Candidatus Aenigmarchaeota archaeon]|nr:hypothetical protein [Candidatus Aenigmarchaeota archaeon]
MKPEPFRIDDSRMPVLLGSATKIPSYAYPNWGIPPGRYRDKSDDLYSVEWKGGSPRQMQYVIDAVTRAGLGNYSVMLRDAAAESVSDIVKRKKGRVNIFEPGAGVSTEVIYKKLYEEGVDLGRVTFVMVEPSQSRVEGSAAKLESDYGLRRGKHLHVHCGKDTDSPRFAEPCSQDIVVCVAQIHHHSYLDKPLTMLHHVTAPGGYLVIADWHNSMWEHPSRVYVYLKNQFEWETKDRDLAAFVKAFPRAIREFPETSPTLIEANEQIRQYWKDGWEVIRDEAIFKGEFKPDDDILMLEGHRPVRKYEDEIEAVGYVLDDTFYRRTDSRKLLIPRSEILAQLIAKKPKE